MKVAVFTGPGAVEIREEPDPVAGPDQVVVEVAACGVCTFERRLFAGEKQWGAWVGFANSWLPRP